MTDTPESQKEVAKALPRDPEEKTPEPTFPEGGTQAWIAVAGAFSMMACTFGYVSTFGVFQSYYHNVMLTENTHSQIAWIGSVQTSFLTLAGLLSGPLCDQYGTRVILIPASVLYVIAIMLTSICKEYYQFFLAQGILGGFCMGLLYTPSISIVGHYFQKRRDFAIGISSAGSPLGGVIFPIMLLRFFEHTNLGFGWSVRIVGFLILGLLAFGCATLKPRVSPRRGPHFLPAAFKNPVYSLQLVGYALSFWGLYTPLFFLPSFAIRNGISVDWSFYVMPLYNVGSFAGRVIASRVTIYLGRFNTMIAAILISTILMYCWIAATSLGGIIAFAILFGFTSGAIIGLFPATVAMTAPQANQIGTYLGMMMGALGVFALTSAPMMGAIEARTGSFTDPIIASGTFMMGGGVAIIGARFAHAGKAIIA